PHARFSRVQTVAFTLLLLIAGSEFLYRGPVRGFRAVAFNDFSTSYVASRLWLQGSDPYDASLFLQALVAAGGKESAAHGSATSMRPAYPPSMLPIMTLVAALPFGSAAAAFETISLALFAGMLWAVMRIYGFAWVSAPGLVLIAYALALAPWHTALAVLSPSGIAIELAVIGIALSRAESGGVVTGFSLCLKPQVAVCFLVFQLATKQWKRAWWSLATVALSTAVALARMPHGWVNSYHANLHYFQASGGVNDFTTANPIRFDLVNLQVPFYFLFHDDRLANLAAAMVAGTLALLWWRKRGDLAGIVLIGLLPFYQRIYNAGLVVLAIAWGFAHIHERRGKAALFASAVFLIPGGALLQTIHAKGWISDAAWRDNILLNVFLGPQATWAILVIVFLVVSAAKSREGSAVETRHNAAVAAVNSVNPTLAQTTR
ncbi:MAG TPA: glycosyltransferase family 87 protein, partial [Terriglobales bacterium]|nr:glycosyltransferase family 87 protein [Terriglobales bacterium]